MESQDKTGHVSPKEVICLLCVILQELFQKRQNLIGWTEARPYLTSSQFKKGKVFPQLSCSSFSKIDNVCSSRNRVSKSVIKLSYVNSLILQSMLRIVLKSKQNFLRDRFKVNFGSVFA